LHNRNAKKAWQAPGAKRKGLSPMAKEGVFQTRHFSSKAIK
jgi:hypothetical protein